MMAVIQSKELSFAKMELENIRRHVSCEALVELGIPDVPAGVEAVASCLSNVSIVLTKVVLVRPQHTERVGVILDIK